MTGGQQQQQQQRHIDSVAQVLVAGTHSRAAVY